MVEDRIQDLDPVTCSIFQIYFYDNLFNLDQSSKIQNKTKLNKKKKEENLLNQLFVLDAQKQNVTKINKYANYHDIMIIWLTCSRANNYLLIRYC